MINVCDTGELVCTYAVHHIASSTCLINIAGIVQGLRIFAYRCECEGEGVNELGGRRTEHKAYSPVLIEG